MRRLRKRAIELIEERLARAERMARGEEPVPEERMDVKEYVGTILSILAHNVQFAVNLGLFDWVQDRELLDRWKTRARNLHSGTGQH